MRSEIFTHMPHPYHMEDSGDEKGVWVHRIIPGMKHIPTPECDCSPRRFSEEEIGDDGCLPPMEVLKLNVRH